MAGMVADANLPDARGPLRCFQTRKQVLQLDVTYTMCASARPLIAVNRG